MLHTIEGKCIYSGAKHYGTFPEVNNVISMHSIDAYYCTFVYKKICFVYHELLCIVNNYEETLNCAMFYVEHNNNCSKVFIVWCNCEAQQ